METIELKKIHVSRTNPRKYFDEKALAELTESVKKHGVLQPVLVRHLEIDDKRDGVYELVAGERRFRAAKAAGLPEIPARVMKLTDQEAIEIQALENLHRQDLSPIEEARAFKALLDIGGYTIESLAQRVDKSMQYVYRSIRLLELPHKAIAALEEGTLTTGHAHQILRAPEKYRDAIVRYALTKVGWKILQFPSVADVRKHVEATVAKDLAHAPFPTNVTYAGEIACTTCPFNSGNQGALFDGATQGQCTNPPCYHKKTDARVKELREQGAKKFAGLEFVGSGVDRGWSSEKRLKGLPVVSATDAVVKKALARSPDKFGFGVLRTDGYGDTRKPAVVLVCKDPSVLGKKAKELPEPRVSPEEQERINFINQAQKRAGWKAVFSKMPVTIDALAEVVDAFADNVYSDTELVLEAAGINPDDNRMKQLRNGSRDELLRALVCLQVEDLEVAAKRAGVTLGPITKAAVQSAEEAWAKAKAAKE